MKSWPSRFNQYDGRLLGFPSNDELSTGLRKRCLGYNELCGWLIPWSRGGISEGGNNGLGILGRISFGLFGLGIVLYELLYRVACAKPFLVVCCAFIDREV